MTEPHVLLVEDDPDRALLTQRALSESQVDPEVDVVGTAEGAVDYLADHAEAPPGLVLLDLGLPDKDGFHVLERMGETEAIPSIPVIVLTSSDEAGDLERSYELGANGYVTKPVDFDEFREAIARIARFWLEINMPPPEAKPP